ncbi:MAG: hypothetical protein KGM17_05375 [Sphingomonadales bacterium]|nr:hypothetical protein [Sphingomonadales bacterium]
MVRKLPIIALSALSLSALAISTAAGATAAPTGDPWRQTAIVAADLHARLAAQPVPAANVRLELARLAALRGTLAAERRVQGGVLSAEQRARAFGRLEAIERAAR